MSVWWKLGMTALLVVGSLVWGLLLGWSMERHNRRMGEGLADHFRELMCFAGECLGLWIKVAGAALAVALALLASLPLFLAAIKAWYPAR